MFNHCSPPGQDDWNGTQQLVPGKAPPPTRGAKTAYREHAYRPYWSRLATLNVSPWLPPVYHGSSCFKQPDKSNCPFCLWFGLLLHRTLYERANSELKIWTGFLRFDRNPPHPPSPIPTLLLQPTNQPPTHPSNQPKRLLDGLEMRSWRLFFVLFHLNFCLCCWIFFSLTLFTPSGFFALLIVNFFKCLEVIISSGISGSLHTCLRNPF